VDRLSLLFGAEVDDDGLPYYTLVDDATHRDCKQYSGLREESIQGALHESLIALEESHVLRDTTHPVIQPIYGRLSEGKLQTLLDHRPSWSGLIAFVVALREGDPISIGEHTTNTDRIHLRGIQSTATVGRPSNQAVLNGLGTTESMKRPHPAQ